MRKPKSGARLNEQFTNGIYMVSLYKCCYVNRSVRFNIVDAY